MDVYLCLTKMFKNCYILLAKLRNLKTVVSFKSKTLGKSYGFPAKFNILNIFQNICTFAGRISLFGYTGYFLLAVVHVRVYLSLIP